jgi:hypothetical protein
MTEPFTPETFKAYFFGNFACIMVDITAGNSDFWKQDRPPEFWNTVILGAFYVFLVCRCNTLKCRSSQTIRGVVHMSAMLGNPFPALQPSDDQFYSSGSGARTWVRPTPCIGISPLCSEIRLQEFHFQLGFCNKCRKY